MSWGLARDGARLDLPNKEATEPGARNWMEWYHGSPFEKAVEPLTEQAWSILKDKKNGIFKYWVDYARRHPEGVGAEDA